MSSPASPGPATEHVGPFQFAILVLSVVALAAIAVDAIFTLPSEVSRILRGLDFLACLAFLADFVIRFRAAESKLGFLRWGWIDLIASIPNVDFLRVGRFVRVLRVLRLIRGLQSMRHLARVMYASRVRGGATTIAMTMLLLVVSSSIAMLLCETGEGANIKTAEDAVWWSVTTVTTVGYGDRYPVTPQGRLVAIGLMFAGVGMFGALSGLIATLFVGRSDSDNGLAAELSALRLEVQRLRPPETGRGGPEPAGPK